MRHLISTGSPTETELGFSRAVVAAGLVHVAGCSGLRREPGAEPGDAVSQFHVAIGKVSQVLAEAGSCLEDVVRTRVYLVRPEDFEALGRAHGEVFGQIRPASTMVQVGRLVDPAMLVEVEVSATAPQPVPAGDQYAP